MTGGPGGAKPLLRAAWTPLALALARARAVPGRWVPAAAGIATAAALLGVAAGGGALAGEQAARRVLASGPDTGHQVQVVWSGGLPAGTEARARRGLAVMTPAAQTASVSLRPTRLGPRRTLVQIAGIAPLRRWVRLGSGRLPRRCTPVRCEVLQVGGPPAPGPLREAGARLVTVGRGQLRSAVPLGFVPGPVVAGEPQGGPPPVLVTGDPDGLEGLSALASVYRTHSWSAPLRAAGTPSWELDGLAARLGRARARLEASDTGYQVSAPLGALRAAAGRAQAARRRVLLLGGAAATLLAGFLLLAAGVLGRDLGAERARLARRGARPWQLALLAGGEAAWPAALGVVAGAAVAVAVTALRGHAAGVPIGPLLGHSLLGGPGIAALLAGWAIATLLLAAGAREWSAAAGRGADAIALAAAGALAIALARGGVSARELASGADPLPLLLPVLACLAAGLVVARAGAPALRAAARAGRRAPVAARIAALGLARSPRQPALTLAFVAVACGLAAFAATYAATLRTGERDAAAFRVPLDVTVREGPDFTPPLRLASLTRWRTLAGGERVLPVVRQSATVPRGAARAALPLLGVPAAGLGALRGWRDGDASASRAQLARRIAGEGPAGIAGPRVPVGTRALRVRARASGDSVDLVAHVALADGSVDRVELGTAGPAARILEGRLPGAAAGGRLLGVAAQPTTGVQATLGHDLAESPAAPGVVAGRLTLGPLAAVGAGGPRPLGTYTGWVATGSFRAPGARGRTISAPYAFDRGGVSLLRPAQPTDGQAIPVLADPATARDAGPGGILPLSVADAQLRARVVGTVKRFPTVGRDAAGFLVADEQRLVTAINAASPGAGPPDELWMAVPERREARLLATLRRPPLGILGVSSRRALQAGLRADPLSRELLRTLGISALVALGLAALGLLLATAAALRDEGAELFDLEAQGVEPRALKANVRLRAGLLAALGVVAGLILGGLLALLVVDALRASATSAAPQPPLVTVVPWLEWGAGAAAFGLVAMAAVWALTLRAFAGPVPRQRPGMGP